MRVLCIAAIAIVVRPLLLPAELPQEPMPIPYVPLPRPTKGKYGNDIVYYIVVDRFFDGNPGNNIPSFAFPDDSSLPPDRRQLNRENAALLPMIYDPTRSYMAMYWGGDLEGIRQKLDYLADLGVTKIVLTPIMDNANGYLMDAGDYYLRRSRNDRPAQPDYAHMITAYHGYWIRDWYALEEHFRNPEDETRNPYAVFRHLLNEAAERGIGIMLDITLNHIYPLGSTWPDRGRIFSLNHPLTQFDASASRTHNAGWFHRYFPIDFTNPSPKELEEGVLFGGMPDLNQEVPSVDRYLLNAVAFWLHINPGGASIAGFRVDAIKHVPLQFWRRFEETVISLKPDAILMGEYFDGGYFSPRSLSFIEHTDYFSQYDFSASMAMRGFFAGDRSWDGRAYVLKELLSPEIPAPSSFWRRLLNPANILGVPPSARQIAPFPTAAGWGLFLENHDLPRLRTKYPKMSDAAYLSAIAFQMVSPRVPLLTYGTEVGLAAPWDPRESGLFGIGGEPFSRLMMIFPGDPGWNQALYAGTKKLIAFRKAYSFLRYGRGAFFLPQGASASDDLFLWRYPQSPQDLESVLYAYSTRGGRFSISIPTATKAVDVLSERDIQTSERSLDLFLEPQTAKVLLLRRTLAAPILSPGPTRGEP